MIAIQDLEVRFGGVKPIDGLTARLHAPIVGLIGPNGAGKTTLLNVFSGFVTPVRGSVQVNGVELLGTAPYRRGRLGLRRTFQTDQVADDLSLRDNVQALADHAGGSHADHAAVARAIDYVGLSHRSKVLGEQLTTSERHLAEIARALVGRPALVLMDEPGAGMSEAESANLQKVILGVPRTFGAQVLLIDHDVALISACCATTLVLDFGKLLAYGPTQQVLSRPDVRRAYLGETPEALEQALEAVP